MGEFGRQRIEKELAWKYSVANLLAAYERAFRKLESSTDMAPRSAGPETDKRRSVAVTSQASGDNQQ